MSDQIFPFDEQSQEDPRTSESDHIASEASSAYDQWLEAQPQPDPEAEEGGKQPSKWARKHFPIVEHARIFAGTLVAEWEDEEYSPEELEALARKAEEDEEDAVPVVVIPSVDIEESRSWRLFRRRKRKEEAEAAEPAAEPDDVQAALAGAINRFADVLEKLDAHLLPQSPLTNTRVAEPFARAEHQYLSALAQMQAGQLEPDAARERIDNLRFAHEGTEWSIGYDGTWYRFDDYLQEWVEATPPEPANVEALVENTGDSSWADLWSTAQNEAGADDSDPADTEADDVVSASDAEASSGSDVGDEAEEDLQQAPDWQAFGSEATADVPEADEHSYELSEPAVYDGDESADSEETVEADGEGAEESSYSADWPEVTAGEEDADTGTVSPSEDEEAEDALYEMEDADTAFGSDTETASFEFSEAPDVPADGDGATDWSDAADDTLAAGQVVESERAAATEPEVAAPHPSIPAPVTATLRDRAPGLEKFFEAEQTFRRAVEDYKAGVVSAAEANAIIEKIVVFHEGVRWSIGGETGRWYRFDRSAGAGRYVPDVPPHRR